MAWRSPDFYQNEIGHGKSTDMNISPVIGALSEQGSAPSFRVHPGALFADWRFWVALMIIVLVIGKATGSPSTDYYNGIEVGSK